MATKAKFPKTITLVRETDSDGSSWFSVIEDLETVDETRGAAVYELKQVGEIVVERTLNVAFKGK